jgi:hypothetical protein
VEEGHGRIAEEVGQERGAEVAEDANVSVVGVEGLGK